MLGSIFLSRYRVERSFHECGLYRAYELRDVLGGQRGLLFLYPLEGRRPLDLLGFHYRQHRLAEICGARIPTCRLGEDSGHFYVLLEIDEGASPLGLPLADAALQELTRTVFRDLAACRAEGLRLYQLSPQLIWRDGGGRPFYLPPLYLQFPGFLDLDDTTLDPAAELHIGRELLLDTDLHGFGRLVERFATEKRDWEPFRERILPRLLTEEADRRPPISEVLAATPLAGDEEIEELLSRDRQVKLDLPEPASSRLEALTRDFRNGENLWATLKDDPTGRILRAMDLQLCRSGECQGEGGALGWTAPSEGDSAGRESVLRFHDLTRPEELLSPLWEGDEARREPRHIFALVTGVGIDRHPELARRAEEILGEWSRLRRLDIDTGADPSPDPTAFAALWSGCSAESRQLLEILALQDAPFSLGLLGSFFSQERVSFFGRVAELDSLGVLRWRPGVDIATGRWGLRAELADAAWKQWIREEMEPERRMELHRLCTDLFPVGDEASDHCAVQRIHHLEGARNWSRLADEGLSLFHGARRQGRSLLLEYLAGILRREAVESRLDLDGKRTVYIHLGRGMVQQGDLSAAAELYGDGLRSLTGNARFLDELLDDRPHRPAAEGVGDPALLPAVSALIRELAEIGETRGEFAWAIRILGRLLDAFSEELSAFERGLLLNEQAWLNYRMGEHERAVERCEVALRLFDPTEHQAELGQTYNTLGAAQWALNRWSEAEAYYKRALILRERSGDQNRIAASLNNLGNLYRLTERFPLAIDYFNRSMAIKKRLKNYAGYLISLYNVALINFELNDFKAARSQSQECLELNRLVGNIQLGAEVQGLMGEIEQVEGRPVEAAEHLKAAIATCREIEAHTELATMLRRLVPVQLALGDIGGAEINIEEGLRVVWRVNNRLEEARIHGYAADFHMVRGDRERAVASLEKAADLYSTLDRHEELARIYSRLGLLHLEVGDEMKARECLQQATGIIERRKVGALIAEWDTLQLRLQQRLGHFVQRIESDGKLRLASFYQILALLEGVEVREEGLELVLRLMRESLGYQQAWIAQDEGGGHTRWFGGEAEEVGELEALWRERTDDPDLLARDLEVQGRVQRMLLAPIPEATGRPASLILERGEAGGAELGGEERDFLTALTRLFAANLRPRESFAQAPVAVAGERARSPVPATEAPRLVGSGREMQRIRKLIARVRDVETTVLITGESGTGKEEVARAIHYEGSRRGCPFLAVNCASIPETLLESTLFGHERGAFTGASHRHIGVFEEATGGTIFLDEIGEMGADMQAKLLRVLQSKEFTRVGGTRSLRTDVRVLTATNRDLEEEVKQHRFREDLFYRINVLRVRVAPLREKREDILPLTEFFLAQAGAGMMGGAKRLSPEVMETFMHHPWPGNIRQLQNVISSCVVLSRGQIIDMEDLPEDFMDARSQIVSHRSLDDLAEMVVASGDYSEESPLEENLLAALAHHLVGQVGSKAKAARLLGISKPTLYRRLRNYDTLRKGGETGV